MKIIILETALLTQTILKNKSNLTELALKIYL